MQIGDRECFSTVVLLTFERRVQEYLNELAAISFLSATPIHPYQIAKAHRDQSSSISSIETVGTGEQPAALTECRCDAPSQLDSKAKNRCELERNLFYFAEAASFRFDATFSYRFLKTDSNCKSALPFGSWPLNGYCGSTSHSLVSHSRFSLWRNFLVTVTL